MTHGAPAANAPLFVYGTLRPALAPVELRTRLEGVDVLGPARVRGRLYDLGSYPGAVPDPQAPHWIRGELLVLPGAAWPWLDRYEGFDARRAGRSLFVRERCVAVDGERRSVACWIYRYNRDPGGLPLVAHGDWSRAG